MDARAEVQKERDRVLAIIDAHKGSLDTLHARLWNLINSGVDLAEEMRKPPKDRPSGFRWPDE